HAELLTLCDQIGTKFRGIGTMGSSFTGRLFNRVHVSASMIVDTYALTRSYRMPDGMTSRLRAIEHRRQITAHLSSWRQLTLGSQNPSAF
ncbi:hypothetical protein WM40_26975, partial [Robbsia andropogonis]